MHDPISTIPILFLEILDSLTVKSIMLKLLSVMCMRPVDRSSLAAQLLVILVQIL